MFGLGNFSMLLTEEEYSKRYLCIWLIEEVKKIKTMTIFSRFNSLATKHKSINQMIYSSIEDAVHRWKRQQEEAMMRP